MVATEVGRKGGVQALGGNGRDSALSFDASVFSEEESISTIRLTSCYLGRDETFMRQS